MPFNSVQPLSLIIGFALTMTATSASAVSFQGLGFLNDPAAFSLALEISADGSKVVGTSNDGAGDKAFLWTQAGGMVSLGVLNGGVTVGTGVTNNGTVVGYEQGTVTQAFSWTQGGGIVGLGDLPGGLVESQAHAIADNGTTIVGNGYSDNYRATRWTQPDGVAAIPNAENYRSAGFGVSADGSVIVGGRGFNNTAFHWTAIDGTTSLGDLTGGTEQSVAFDLSANGLTAVGWSTSSLGNEAFSWTLAGGMVGLGDLANGSFESMAYGTSANGQTIVGYGMSDMGKEAFIWDSVNGMRSLNELLITQGLDLNGWTLTEARGVSDDGLTIVGIGLNSLGDTEGWIIKLDTTVPEPNALVLLFIGAGAALSRNKK